MSIFERFRSTPDLHTELMDGVQTTESASYIDPSTSPEITYGVSDLVPADEDTEISAEDAEYYANIEESINDMKDLSAEELLNDAADDMARGDYEFYDNEDPVEATAYYTRAAAVGNRALALILLAQQNTPTVE